MNLSIRNSNYHITTWAVVAGTAVALSVEIVLNLLGVGLGLTNMNLNLNSLFKTGIGAVIWLALSGCIAMAMGGWVAGKLSAGDTKDRIMHGFLAWSFATLIAVLATTSAAGAIIGGPTNVMGGSMGSRVTQHAKSTMEATSGLENNGGGDQQSTAETAGEGIGGASIAMFVAFLLSAAASMLAASRAKSRDDLLSDGQGSNRIS